MAGYKLGRVLTDGSEVEFAHPPHFMRESLATGDDRIRAGISRRGVAVISALLELLDEPIYLLYVLHTPRGGQLAGRYQSPPCSKTDVRAFLASFENYLSNDARFDLWFHSPASETTVVWDRHDWLFAYGSLGAFEAVLRRLEFRPGPVDVAVSHTHHYRSEHDSSAIDVLARFDWQRSELQPEDEQ